MNLSSQLGRSVNGPSLPSFTCEVALSSSCLLSVEFFRGVLLEDYSLENLIDARACCVSIEEQGTTPTRVESLAKSMDARE